MYMAESAPVEIIFLKHKMQLTFTHLVYDRS